MRRLRELRKESRMTLAGLCERLGGSPSISQLARIELGEQQASVDLMLALSRIYGVPITELIDDDRPGGQRVAVKFVVGERTGDDPDYSITLPPGIRGYLSGAEIRDRSCDYLYKPGTIVICRAAEDWDGTIVGRRVIARPSGLPSQLTLREVVQDESGQVWLVARTSQPHRAAPIRLEDAQVLHVVVASFRPE